MPAGSNPVRIGLALLLAVVSFPAAAVAGAWTTYLRAEVYSDLVARHDTVWCASLEGGLLRYLPAVDRFESITREPGGLASQALTALEFDRPGRLWVGTSDRGVSRLSVDGGSWDLISELDGLPQGKVRVLRAVGDTMLIGTDHGLALWNGSEIVGVFPDGVNPSPFASDVVSGLVLRGDTLWVSTAKGLYVSRASTGLSSWAGLADTAVVNRALLALAWDGSTLMTVAGGVPRVFDEASRTWVSSGGIGTVLALSDDRGVILASSTSGVFRWEGAGWVGIPDAPGSSTCAPLGNPACGGIVVTTTDESGRLWGANRAGLADWVDDVRTLHEPDSPAGNNIQNIALQGSRVYVTTNIEGVARFDGTHWRNWLVTGCGSGCDTTFLSSAYAFGLLVDQQGMKWVANYGSAIESFDDDVSPPVFTHHQPGDDALSRHLHTCGWAAAADSNGGRWFGMDSDIEPPPIGIEYYDADGEYRANYLPGNTPTMLSSKVRALFVDQPHGNLWAGYAGTGVTVFDLPTEPGGPLNLTVGGAMSAIDALDVFGIAAHKDSVWVMSTADLRVFSSLTLRQLGTARSLVGSPAPIGACHPLDVGPDGRAWVGTDAGVHAYGPGGSVVEYTVANSPLAGDVVRAIRVDPVSGVVWIGTATGLSRFDPAYTPPAEPELPTLEVLAYPNPAWLTGAGLALRLAGNATAYHGAIYDVNGRKVHGFDGQNKQVFWDGRDATGALVHPGVYFVRVEASGHARTLRVALLR
jgi:ligand-binding sensor domain-containing protein